MRLAGAALGGVGVLLAASTTVWPTRVFAVRVPEVGDFTKGYEQRIWSWGRQVVYSSDGVLLDAFAGPNPVPRLVLLVVVLVLAAAGLAAWVVVQGRRGELLAAVGLGMALATVTSSVIERVSFDDRSMGPQPGLVEVTTTAAWLEVVVGRGARGDARSRGRPGRAPGSERSTGASVRAERLDGAARRVTARGRATQQHAYALGGVQRRPRLTREGGCSSCPRVGARGYRRSMDMKLELVAVPVTDVDRAKEFYVEKVGFNADHDHTVSDEIRFVQLTPPGSACSIAIGKGLTRSRPARLDNLQLVIADADAARAELVGRGVEASRGRGAAVGPLRLLQRP